jgi:hypothetical protein
MYVVRKQHKYVTMLLRIDVYPHNSSLTDTDADGVPVSPIPPLYACLGTSKEDGLLFTVGRKDTDVALSDKSVSRNHLSVSLVSAIDSIGDRITVKPKTRQEEQACADNPDGMCIVITDSSRFGSFLVRDGGSKRSPAPTDDNDDETGGDETEDENEKPNAAAPPLSPVTAMLTSSSATLEKLEPQSPVVMTEFNERVLIQCGQNGSTLVIRRIPLRLAWSRLDNSTKQLWTKRLPALGATTLPTAHESMTHLVTNEIIANAKHLAAWYLQKPMVTTEYLQALWDRRSPTDPMPKETDVEPTGDKAEFWKATPNSKLWSGCMFLCLLQDDMECLCRAAGADSVPLYHLSEREALQVIKKLKDPSNAFYISTATAKVARYVRHLQKEHIPCVTQRIIASCVAKQLQLKDNEGNAIGSSTDGHPTDGNDDEQTSQVLVAPREEKHAPLAPIEMIPEESMEEPTVDQTDDVEPPASSRKRASSLEELSQEEPQNQRRKMAHESVEPASCSKRSRKEEFDTEEPPTQRMKLAVSSDGWLIAAPSNRRAYRRSTDEDEQPLVAPADTECASLVVGPSSKRKEGASARGGGKDFKRFRKNVVPRGGLSRIVLRSVLPKESEVQQELEDRQLELEEEQRAADALFREPGAGIRSHFKPKKKRGRS